MQEWDDCCCDATSQDLANFETDSDSDFILKDSQEQTFDAVEFLEQAGLLHIYEPEEEKKEDIDALNQFDLDIDEFYQNDDEEMKLEVKSEFSQMSFSKPMPKPPLVELSNLSLDPVFEVNKEETKSNENVFSKIFEVNQSKNKKSKYTECHYLLKRKTLRMMKKFYKRIFDEEQTNLQSWYKRYLRTMS